MHSPLTQTGDIRFYRREWGKATMGELSIWQLGMQCVKRWPVHTATGIRFIHGFSIIKCVISIEASTNGQGRRFVFLKGLYSAFSKKTIWLIFPLTSLQHLGIRKTSMGLVPTKFLYSWCSTSYNIVMLYYVFGPHSLSLLRASCQSKMKKVCILKGKSSDCNRSLL